MKHMLAVALLFAVSMSTHAATAYLVNCAAGLSVTGLSVFIGTYQYGGQTFTRTFPMANGYCPISVEVY